MQVVTTSEGYDSLYQLVGNDQPRLTLVFLERGRRETRLRPRYEQIACRSCGGFDLDRAFDLGFDEDVDVRIKGDFGWSDDKLLLASARMTEAFECEGVGGFEAKPVGRNGWSAIRVTCVVEADPKVMKTSGRRCKECRLPEEVYGSFDRLKQVRPPAAANTLFTANVRRCSTVVERRLVRGDVFLTGQAIAALRRHRIKGGACRQLMTEAEWKEVVAAHKSGGPLKYAATVLLR